MRTEEKRVSLFLDTNILQSFFGAKKEKNVFLDKTGVPGEYYQLVEFINRYRLAEKIEICIPSVVIMECKQHMRDCFSRNVEQLDFDMKKYKKMFGSLLAFEYEFKITQKDYSAYLSKQ